MTETLEKVSPEERVGELDKELTTLHEQLERAQGIIGEADSEKRRIEERQDEIAVAVISEDEAAQEEHSELVDELVVQTRRASTARVAVGKLEEQIAATKALKDKAVSEVHRERFNELARERGHVEAEIEEAMSALLDGITELADIHSKQIREAQGVGTSFGQSVAGQSLQSRVQSYLGARLHQWGMPTTVSSTLYAKASLAEADPLAVADDA
jgi:chromosome segregation ATPase